jgi:hypothetical protein
LSLDSLRIRAMPNVTIIANTGNTMIGEFNGIILFSASL